MSVSITLKRDLSYDTDTDLWTMKVWVSEIENMPPEVFLIHEVPSLPEDDDLPTGSFVRTCSYADMNNYRTQTDVPRRFWRRRWLHLLFESKSEAVSFWNSLKTDVQSLCDEIMAVNDAAASTENYSY